MFNNATYGLWNVKRHFQKKLKVNYNESTRMESESVLDGTTNLHAVNTDEALMFNLNMKL